jgi:MSHA pilin protein MshD
VMEEIMLRAYDDPDPGVTKNEVSRADFDDVSDYNGKTQAVFTDLPIDLAGYNILIAVASAENFMGVAMKKVTVTVRRGSESVSLSSYRGKDGSS